MSLEIVVHAMAVLLGSLRNRVRMSRIPASRRAWDSSSEPEAMVLRTPREERWT